MATVSITLASDNTWSNSFRIRNFFDLSIYSANNYNMTVTLQRRRSEGEAWRDVANFMTNFEGYDYSPIAYLYRIGVKEGNHTFGSVEVSVTTD